MSAAPRGRTSVRPAGRRASGHGFAAELACCCWTSLRPSFLLLLFPRVRLRLTRGYRVVRPLWGRGASGVALCGAGVPLVSPSAGPECLWCRPLRGRSASGVALYGAGVPPVSPSVGPLSPAVCLFFSLLSHVGVWGYTAAFLWRGRTCALYGKLLMRTGGSVRFLGEFLCLRALDLLLHPVFSPICPLDFLRHPMDWPKHPMDFSFGGHFSRESWPRFVPYSGKNRILRAPCGRSSFVFVSLSESFAFRLFVPDGAGARRWRTRRVKKWTTPLPWRGLRWVQVP